MEIYRREWKTDEGRESTTISCRFLDNGTLRIEGQDIGPSVERLQGDSDYEYWMEIAADDIGRLVPALLKETFNAEGRLTFERVRDLCRENGIDSNFNVWR
jgi:hypothetical protein